MKKFFLFGTFVLVIFAVFFLSNQLTAQIKDVLATPTKSLNNTQIKSVSPFGGISFPSDPFFGDMEKEMNRVFDSFRSRAFSNGFVTSMPGTGINMTTGRADVKQVGDNLVITIDLPGHEKSSLDLRIKDGDLIISSERKSQFKDKKGKYFRQEISYGKFSRVIALPKKIIEDKISAKFSNGVLTVTAPIDNSKPVEPQGHKITIN